MSTRTGDYRTIITFRGYLRTQIDRQDAIGDLARDALADRDWPTRRHRGYLADQGASDETKTALEAALLAWKADDRRLRLRRRRRRTERALPAGNEVLRASLDRDRVARTMWSMSVQAVRAWVTSHRLDGWPTFDYLGREDTARLGEALVSAGCPIVDTPARTVSLVIDFVAERRAEKRRAYARQVERAS